MSTVDELARRIRILESQQQFFGAGNSVEDPFVNAIARGVSYVQGLPALRAYWPMNVLNSSGDILDISGAGITLTRTATLMEAAAVVRRGLFFNGTTAYLRRADGADVDYSGDNTTLTGVAGRRGLTISAWIRPSALSSQQGIVTKWVGGGNLSYVLQIPSAAQTQVRAAVSVDGTAETSVLHPAVMSINNYYHVVLRFAKSTSMDVFVDGVKETNTTSIPASIYNGTAQLNIGARASGTADFYSGYISDVFVSDAALLDGTIVDYYNLTAPMYKQ